ncbi:ribosomal RNA small subunit methyltransferase B [Sphaceloma murrayae]|uniref:rhamnogalacturonan endolyase n=1 Tax=Sphaceloma murrayae TaxID=2082308 RepID=A0A2K1QN69_9PEZI|nr:ribosomal RNA small subunit methyltransferase B [Sphaceloma murrayae]
MLMPARHLLLVSATVGSACAAINATESATQIVIANDRLFTALNKTTGAINYLTLDGQNLLGTRSYTPPTPGGATGDGVNGVLNMDCYCVPSGFWTPGSIAPKFRVVQGTDSGGKAYAGVVMSDVYPQTGQLMEQYWFLRDGETGLHAFSRLQYVNETTPFLRNLQEFRTLFRPNSALWTHLSTNDDFFAPSPRPNPASTGLGVATTVQDATWYLGNRTNDPYVTSTSDYFTKYTFQDAWRDLTAHGMFSDGSTSDDNSTFGAWMVTNTKDTYYGGPTHSDLVVDGIVYNYLVSNHHGANVPNITTGFDRTFGPQYYYFNKGDKGGSLDALRQDAVQYSNPDFAADFYDSIAEYVPNYVPTSGRGKWTAKIQLPEGAGRPVAILSLSGYDYQDNAFDYAAHQYWADISEDGTVEIDRVVADTYRLTIYADGIFGQFEVDGIVVEAGQTTTTTELVWEAESAGTELWRIGIPDKSSGEYRHGVARTDAPLAPPEFRIYFGAYDFPTDFPDGVSYHVGEGDISQDLNYVHWSVYGGKAHFLRPERYVGDGNVNNWTITFDLTAEQIASSTEATLTVQLAGAKTASGNTDVYNVTQPWANLPLTIDVNGNGVEPWVIPYNQSSSCAVRSSVSCYNIAHKYVFPSSFLIGGGNSTNGTYGATAPVARNELILSLPFNATDYESALLPESVYIQYDALRLEVR